MQHRYRPGDTKQRCFIRLADPVGEEAGKGSSSSRVSCALTDGCCLGLESSADLTMLGIHEGSLPWLQRVVSGQSDLLRGSWLPPDLSIPREPCGKCVVFCDLVSEVM